MKAVLEGWRRPPQGGVFDLGFSLVCQGVMWKQWSGQRA